jgi:hypothetical protein
MIEKPKTCAAERAAFRAALDGHVECVEALLAWFGGLVFEETISGAVLGGHVDCLEALNRCASTELSL